jgi:hypothetical protein
MMTEEKILPEGVSWREIADHWLTHDPLPERGENDALRQLTGA